jgi:hypothetical protein
MPSHNHEILKIKALEFLYQVKKCKLVATELKFGKYIYDVVGTDMNRIYIIEAKARKGDYTRDNHSPDEIRENINEFKRLLKETGDTDYVDKIEKEKNKSTKFYDKGIFKLANECYIIAPDEMVGQPPEGWGLLNEEPMTVVEAPKRKVDKKWIGKVIGEIGKKFTKMYLKTLGVEFQGKKVVFPDTFLLDEDKIIEEEDNGT